MVLFSVELFDRPNSSLAMSTKTMFSRLKRPVGHAEFWGPGLFILGFSLFFLCLGLWLGVGGDSLKFSIVGLVTGALLMFRTRIGTALYFCLIFSLAIDRYEEGFDFSSLRSALRIIMNLFLFVCMTLVGWEQVDYHFNRHRRS